MLYSNVERDRRALQENPDMVKAYQEWLQDPITQRIIGILTVEGQPQTPAMLNGEVACLNLGNSIGWANCLHRMQSLDRVTKQEEPESTYEQVQGE